MVVLTYGRTMLDIGNLDKSLLDALEGVLMVSDAQVRASLSLGPRTTQDPGVLVAVARLSAHTAGDVEVAEAGAELLRQVGTGCYRAPATGGSGDVRPRLDDLTG